LRGVEDGVCLRNGRRQKRYCSCYWKSARYNQMGAVCLHSLALSLSMYICMCVSHVYEYVF